VGTIINVKAVSEKNKGICSTEDKWYNAMSPSEHMVKADLKGKKVELVLDEEKKNKFIHLTVIGDSEEKPKSHSTVKSDQFRTKEEIIRTEALNTAIKALKTCKEELSIDNIMDTAILMANNKIIPFVKGETVQPTEETVE